MWICCSAKFLWQKFNYLRKKFGQILSKLKIPVPKWGTAFSINEALNVAEKINYPVLVRPSYVLGGRGMKIVYNNDDLKYSLQNENDPFDPY